MSDSTAWTLFNPPRRKGFALNLFVLLLDFTLVVILLISALGQPPGLVVILFLLSALLLSLPIPLLMYRVYSLWQSGYWLGRNGLRLRWGLRQIDLPYDEVVDVARADELDQAIQLPRWSWPGSILGELDDEQLGKLEFMASDSNELVLIGTKQRVFVISPQQASEFTQIYRRESERGSLKPVTTRSVQPVFVLAEAWSMALTRRLLIAGGLLALGLLILVGVLAPNLQTVSLGFSASGEALPAVAGVQLFLLPALNLFFYMGNFILGLLFFRETEGTLTSYILWCSSLVTSLFFFGAILFSL